MEDHVITLGEVLTIKNIKEEWSAVNKILNGSKFKSKSIQFDISRVTKTDGVGLQLLCLLARLCEQTPKKYSFGPITDYGKRLESRYGLKLNREEKE